VEHPRGGHDDYAAALARAASEAMKRAPVKTDPAIWRANRRLANAPRLPEQVF
jgi:hypothetical protein